MTAAVPTERIRAAGRAIPTTDVKGIASMIQTGAGKPDRRMGAGMLYEDPQKDKEGLIA